MAAGSSASSPAIETSDYNKADALLWKDMVTLPLYQKPQFFAWSKNLAGGVIPNTLKRTRVTWNGQSWKNTAS